jgi:hypothetical protein
LVSLFCLWISLAWYKNHTKKGLSLVEGFFFFCFWWFLFYIFSLGVNRTTWIYSREVKFCVPAKDGRGRKQVKLFYKVSQDKAMCKIFFLHWFFLYIACDSPFLFSLLSLFFFFKKTRKHTHWNTFVCERVSV